MHSAIHTYDKPCVIQRSSQISIARSDNPHDEPRGAVSPLYNFGKVKKHTFLPDIQLHTNTKLSSTIFRQNRCVIQKLFTTHESHCLHFVQRPGSRAASSGYFSHQIKSKEGHIFWQKFSIRSSKSEVERLAD